MEEELVAAVDLLDQPTPAVDDVLAGRELLIGFGAGRSQQPDIFRRHAQPLRQESVNRSGIVGATPQIGDYAASVMIDADNQSKQPGRQHSQSLQTSEMRYHFAK